MRQLQVEDFSAHSRNVRNTVLHSARGESRLTNYVNKVSAVRDIHESKLALKSALRAGTGIQILK